MAWLGKISIPITLAVILGGCAQPTRMGMVQDPYSGIQSGSVIEKNIFIDSSQFRNKTVKVTTRNTSGDNAYNIDTFAGELHSALLAKGYQPTNSESFGLRVDINVLYSGQAQSNMAAQYGFIGGAAGGVAGYRSGAVAGTATGVLAGATIGSIIGSYVVTDTYMMLAELSIGINSVSDPSAGDKKTITFSSSPALQREAIPSNFVPFREILRTKIAVYAGGRGVSQAQIADLVRRRLVSIAGNSI